MSSMSKDEINVGLFDEVTRLKKSKDKLQIELEVLLDSCKENIERNEKYADL